MIILPNKEEIQDLYLRYADKQLSLIKDKYEGKLADDKKLKAQYNAVQIKKGHGISMMNGVLETTKTSNMFNETYNDSAAIEGCLHDVGRFPQFILSGTLNDKESEAFTGSKDHGAYGRLILLDNDKKLLRYFLKHSSPYDYVLTEIIGEHTNILNPNYDKPITSLTNLFKDYSFEEVVSSNNEELKNSLIALKLKLLQEVDSLELLQNVMSGAWKPAIGYEEKYYAFKEVFEAFKKFERIDMAFFKENGKWTANSGFLLRYGLLTRNANFVGTLKQFIKQDGFTKIFDQTKGNVTNDDNEVMPLTDPLLYEAQEYIKLAVNNLIETSDGVLITPESREAAKQKTLNEWKR